MPGGPAPEPIYEERVLPYDSIVISGGRTPRTTQAAQFEGLAPIVRVIGDNAKVKDVKQATYAGYKAAMLL
jgi:hypothetical protein